MKTLIKNTAVALPTAMLQNQNVLFDDKILYIGENTPEADVEIDGSGLVLAPGFIDIHTHGCGGSDTMDGGEAALNMSEWIIKGGTTSFLPTTVAATPENLHSVLDGVRAAKTQKSGANILGAHVEGPFLAPKYKGAHEEAVLIDPDFEIIRGYSDVVKVVTLAPELNGAKAFIEACSQNNIICSIGHTGATYDQCLTALDWGTKSFTHSYNAMSPLNHREPGTVGALLTSDVFAELICDNIHVAPPAQKVVYTSKGHTKTILITDALRPCMVGDGAFKLGNLPVVVANGRATLADGTLAGSILTMNKAVFNFMQSTGCELWQSIRCATANPAALLGLSHKGRVAVDCDADLVLITPDCEVVCTFVNGAAKYKKPA